jgi:sulfur-carrier protein
VIYHRFCFLPDRAVSPAPRKNKSGDKSPHSKKISRPTTQPKFHMPTVVLAPALARWLTADPQVGAGEKTVVASGTTVQEVLASVFAEHPTLRGYVLDERGALRHHVVAFVNDEPVRDKQSLSEPVPPDGEVYIFQALSGG